jgi:hypothetical protein
MTTRRKVAYQQAGPTIHIAETLPNRNENNPMSNFKAGDVVMLSSTRGDHPVTIIDVDGDRATIKNDRTGQTITVPVTVLYR